MKKQTYLIIYDISDTKVRTKISKELETVGIRLQYSVFFIIETKSKILDICDKLNSLVSCTDDSIFCYKINDKAIYQANYHLLLDNLF